MSTRFGDAGILCQGHRVDAARIMLRKEHLNMGQARTEPDLGRDDVRPPSRTRPRTRIQHGQKQRVMPYLDKLVHAPNRFLRFLADERPNRRKHLFMTRINRKLRQKVVQPDLGEASEITLSQLEFYFRCLNDMAHQLRLRKSHLWGMFPQQRLHPLPLV
jgi:hypothetical protein